ncbi:MAG: hypothetical protein HYY37_04160 [Candidatus Aenigmarchaeota archaeon]|nr:hypothetical protein [Candidatus Aenigmarchaeota archaeon]
MELNSAVKMLIGLLIFAAGVYWYAADILRMPGFSVLGGYALSSLKTVFFGTFGLFLVFFGLIIAWIEYEDMKWEARERKEKMKTKK